MRRYVPDAGDLVWLDFDPQTGREQAGRRPALILTPLLYNEKSGLAIACPITSKVKGYPFEVPLQPGMKIGGVVLSDHLKSVDWIARRAEFIVAIPTGTLDSVRDRLAVLLGCR